MNRRDAIKAAVAAAATGGQVLAGDELIDSPDEQVVAFRFKTAQRLEAYHLRAIHDTIRDAFAKTPWKDIPIIVLDAGVDLDMVRVPKDRA